MVRAKNKSVSNEKVCNKRCRKRISIEQKLSILNKLDNGCSIGETAKLLQLPKSTVDTIKANREKILECGREISLNVAKTTMRTRNSALHKTEQLLHTWIVSQREKGATVSEKLIRCKAFSIFKDVKLEGHSNCNFSASHGWFEKYKKRFNLRSVLLSGESRSADKEAASHFIEEFKDIISEGGFSPQQVFNCDETGLMWKKMPCRTYTTHDDRNVAGYKNSKERVTLLLGGNASGDVKLKPLLLHRAENPRALKHADKDSLPVIWRSNRKAWVTKKVFSEWFQGYFIPFIANYNAEHGLENKALLLLDNAPGHPTDLEMNHPHIKIVFIPPNTTSILQPMDQGIISIFKASYLRQMMNKIVTFTSTSEDSVTSFWKQFNIKFALEMIEIAWDSVTTKALNGVWKNIWPQCVTAKRSHTREIFENCAREICDLSEKAGLTGITIEEVEEELIESEDSFTNEELIVIEHENVIDNMKLKEQNENLKKENLLEILDLADKLKEKVCNFEENKELSATFSSVLEGFMAKYRSKIQEMN